MESIYWVVSRDCNQQCVHCYNRSEPGAQGLTAEEVARCVANLPDPADVPVGRVVLSGGEPLVWPELLLHALDELHRRYGNGTALWIQTNGDRLDGAMLDRLLAHHVRRIDVASMDRFHHRDTLKRRELLEELLQSRGMTSVEEPLPHSDVPAAPAQVYNFWGANPETWIGPLWPRGRAYERGLSTCGPQDRFCGGWSGGKGFLDYRSPGSEVNVQLADVYPCCPMTVAPMGSLLDEPLIAMLERCAQSPIFRSLNDGNPEAMGESLGISEAYGFQRSEELGNHCLWCDEFFKVHAPGVLKEDAPTARVRVETSIGKPMKRRRRKSRDSSEKIRK